jgi:hypothetical protein
MSDIKPLRDFVCAVEAVLDLERRITDRWNQDLTAGEKCQLSEKHIEWRTDNLIRLWDERADTLRRLGRLVEPAWQVICKQANETISTARAIVNKATSLCSRLTEWDQYLRKIMVSVAEKQGDVNPKDFLKLWRTELAKALDFRHQHVEAPLREELDTLQSYVRMADTPKVPEDGPFHGNSFAWRGKVCSELTHLKYLLLSYFWDDGRLIACANYDELKQHVWGGKEVQWSTVKGQVSRTNTTLNEAGIYLGLETDSEYYVRVLEFKNRVGRK